jgi:hypothetical protein
MRVDPQQRQHAPTEELRSLLRERLAADEVRRSLEDDIAASVRRLHMRGLSWADIGALIGTTRQAAWERYGRGEAKQ